MATKQTASTRDQLLKAGRKIVTNDGFHALTVREVAAMAGANLGSFVYHFGTRDHFLQELIEEWYAPVMSRLVPLAERQGKAVDRLRDTILQLLEDGREQQAFMGRLLMAAATGESAAVEFCRSLFKRHPQLLLRLIGEAQAEGSLERDAEPMQLMVFIMGSVGLPLILANAWSGLPLFDKATSVNLGRLARDTAPIAQRLDWAIRGLTPRGS